MDINMPMGALLQRHGTRGKNSKGERPWEGALALWGGGESLPARHDASPAFEF